MSCYNRPVGPSWRWSDRWSRHPHRGGAVGLAVVIALVQTVGTTVAAGDQPDRLDLLGYALLAVSGLALAGRHLSPAVTLLVTAAATVAYSALDYPGGPTFVALIIAVVVAVKAGRRYETWAIIGASYLSWVVLAAPGLTQAAVLAAWAAGLLLLSEAARVRAQQLAQLAQVRAEQARVRSEQERRQASEERLRIAQELHDVLGHHLSLINVQAGVGLHLMDNQPERAREALGTIKQASAEALREVRSVLTALHSASDAAPRAPAPGLERLHELTVDAGLPVRTSVVGPVRPLPADVDRAAYRIVQEALTNVRRHAGAGAAVEVVVEYQGGELVVQVDDDGETADPVTEGGGVRGMRERASALGGSLTAGPRPGGGFRVRVGLPLPGDAP